MGKLLRRVFLCPLGFCPCRQQCDESGCWGECVHCGKRYGFVSRADLRAFADREIARELRRRALSEQEGRE